MRELLRDRFMRNLILFGIAALILGFVCDCREANTSSDCAARGYPNYRVDFSGLGKAYCIKRVNQTDVIVPL